MKKLDVKVKSFPSGFMVWWKKINDAALYTIRLFINQDEIDVITKERTTSYHSFVNMARIHQTSDYGSSTGLNYYVTVVAEDREGKIIAAEAEVSVGEIGCRAVNKRRIDIHGSIEIILRTISGEEKRTVSSVPYSRTVSPSLSFTTRLWYSTSA